MKLRHIEIQGFKSFRDRVSIDLGDGMTAVVGPNGCGKSNVVDAIKWAMGDQSAKSLRGNKMEDVIFAGSESRRPTGLAEVTLVFENDPSNSDMDWGDAIPREFREVAEIAVTRRLHRSGDSEYLINKAPCRLMDIQNLLAGTGIGKQGYSIIEQNRVGFIVSAKPEERRLLIEEASGITRYKGQRDRAERKLEKTEDNLLRLEDVLAEVKKQIRALERQAKRAAQYKSLVAELRALDIALLLARRDELVSERELLVEQTELAEAAIEQAAAAIAEEARRLEAAKVAAFAGERAHADATEAFYRVDTTLNLARSRVEHATVTMQETNRRLGAAEREVTSQTERVEALTAELARIRKELDELGDLVDSTDQVEKVRSEVAALRQDAERQQREIDEARRTVSDSFRDLHRAEDRIEWLQHRGEELKEREASLQEAAETARSARTAVGERLEAEISHVSAIEERLAASQERHADFERAVNQTREESMAAAGKAAELRRVSTQLQTRVEALRTLAGRREGLSEVVRAIVASAAGRSDVYGVHADHVQVDLERAQPLGNFLEARLLDIFVASRDVALELIARAGELDGRVGFRVVPADKTPAQFAQELISGLADAPTPGAQAWLVDHEGPNGIVEFTDGRIVAGKTAAQAVLRQQAELRQLEADLAVALAATDAAEAEAVTSDAAFVAAKQKSELARRETEALQLELRTRQHDLASVRREADQLDEALRAATGEVVPVLAARERLVEERAELDAKILDLRQTGEAAQERLEAMSGQGGELAERLEIRRMELTRLQVEHASKLERKRSLEVAIERSEQSLLDACGLAQKYTEERTTLSARLVELAATIEEQEAELARASAARDDARKSAEAARQKLDAANRTVADVEIEMRRRRTAAEEASTRRQECEFRQREASLSIAHIDEQLAERFDLDAGTAKPLVASVDTPPAERRSKRDWLRNRIDSLGPVNAMAEEEYEAAKERDAFLEEQKADLEAAVADLRQAIARMDRESRRRFKETFEAVNAKFQEIFPALFQGGRAELTLTNPDDLLNTGVDIQVQPPGKRQQSVTLLSGGEKALTAVSLIFSIFVLKPTPFSILDEVDAPLDEANVGRFAQLVKRLSGTSQMLVITHSRRTMEASDMLYGVTMEEPGVSKMVNVRLSELDDKLAS